MFIVCCLVVRCGLLCVVLVVDRVCLLFFVVGCVLFVVCYVLLCFVWYMLVVFFSLIVVICSFVCGVCFMLLLDIR